MAGCKWIEIWVGVGISLASAAAAAPPVPADLVAEVKVFDGQFRPLLTAHCVACHSGEKPKGNLRLDSLGLDLTDTAVREHWADVVERLHEQGMALELTPAAKELLVREGYMPAYGDRKSTRLNSSHIEPSRMPSSA